MLMMKSLLNASLNKIHDWSEPEQYPMKRMFLTRLGALACSTIEVSAITCSILYLGRLSGQELTILSTRTFRWIFPTSSLFSKYSQKKSLLEPIKRTFLDICKLISGLVATIFVGIIFSPELNFRFHLQLGLAVDNLAVKKQKELIAKLRMDAKAAEITKARSERFAQFEATRKTAKEAQAKEDAIDAHLAELLYPKILKHCRKKS